MALIFINTWIWWRRSVPYGGKGQWRKSSNLANKFSSMQPLKVETWMRQCKSVRMNLIALW